MDRFKAQSSIEFVTVVAIAGLLASPFILQAQQSVLNTDKSSDLSQFESSLDNFVNTMERVDTMGEPARDSVWISVPNKIVDTRVESDAIVYTRNTSSGTTKHVKLTDATINEGTLPTTPGLQKVEIEAWGSGINFSAEEFSSSIFSIQSQSDWNKGIFDGSSADSNDGSDKIGIGYVNSSNPSSTSLEEGLVGYWRLDNDVSGDAGTVKDYSGEGSDGRTDGGVNTEQTGVFGTKAFEFDGSSSVNISGPVNPDGADAVTVSAWVKSDNIGTDSAIFGTVTGGGGDSNLGLRYDDNGYAGDGTNVIKFAVETGQGSASGETESDIQTTDWQHVVLRWSSGSSPEIFVDGSEVSYTDNPSSLSGQVEVPDIFIGKGLKDTDGWWDGEIDELRVYNRELSEQQIQSLYFSGQPFQGDYTSEKIENSDKQEWESLEIQASIESSKEDLTATFETLKDSLLRTSEQEYSLNDWEEGSFNGTTTDNILNERNYVSEYQLSTQKEFNQGDYNLTSADRKDNSGDLGLAYLNGSNPSSTGLEDGLVGYWRLDSTDSGVPDYSGAGNDGTLKNGGSKGSQGIFGTNSYNFNNDDDSMVEAPDSSSLDLTSENEVTLSVWVNVKGTSGGNWAHFFGKSDGGTSDDYGLIHNDNDNLEFRVGASDAIDSGNGISISPSDGWTHVVGTFDGSTDTARLYVNGTEEAENTGVTQDITDNDAPFGIGRSPTSTNRYLNGLIDEGRVYNRALSTSEVKELYFNGEPFQGEYTAKRIENNQETSWDKVEVNTTIPSDTSVNATFKVLDSNGDTKDSQFIDLNDGDQNYSLSVDTSEDAEVFINGSSSNPAETWEIHSLDVLSSEALSLGYLNGSNPSSTGLEDGLVGYWRFDKSSGNIVDYSSNDNEGVNNGANRGVKGILGTNGFEFSGNNENISVSDSSSLSGNDPATVSFWMKPDEDLSGGTPNDWGFISKQDEFEIGNSNYHSDGSKLAMGIWGDRLTTSKNSWSAGNWYHVAFVVDSANNVFKVYVDGSPDNSKTPGDSIVGASSDLYIGHSEDHSNSFDGEMDEVRVYDRALSESEIERLYFNGEPFQGSYTAKKIENNEKTVWDKLEIATSVPSETELKAEFEALDSNYNVIDRDYISVDSGTETKNYSLSVPKSENARLSFNGSTSDITKSWSVNSFEVYSKEQQVDDSESFEVDDGSNEFSLGLGDSRDARIKLDGSSSDPTQTWSVSNITVFTK